jgi:phosphoglycerol transferase MdoB-like AlkP superfamily enzyme
MKLLKPALLTGLIAGTLDLTGACVLYMIEHDGQFPNKILEYIAGGAFGKDALTGGLTMKLWGVLFHFLIAIGFTFFYFIIYSKVKLLQKNIFLSAFIYGLFVWAIMNLIVVPNSAWHKPITPFNLAASAKAAFVLIICIGLPVSYYCKKFYTDKKSVG